MRTQKYISTFDVESHLEIIMCWSVEELISIRKYEWTIDELWSLFHVSGAFGEGLLSSYLLHTCNRQQIEQLFTVCVHI